MKYTALIADIKNSRKLSSEEREEIQTLIKKSIEYLNKVFKSSLKFNVIFSAGDEIQGLFNSPVPAYLYLRMLKMIITPVEIRCGIGVGDWDVKILEGTSSEQDGSAYHYARDAISKAHDKNDYSILLNSNQESDIYINTLISTSYLISKQQSQYQSLIFQMIEVIYPLCDNKFMDVQLYKGIYILFEKKVETYFSENNKKSIDNKYLNELIMTNINPFYVLAESKLNNQMIVSSMWKKGISTKIANITNTTRQNTDKVIKAGNIIEVRNIDATILLLLDEIFGGK